MNCSSDKRCESLPDVSLSCSHSFCSIRNLLIFADTCCCSGLDRNALSSHAIVFPWTLSTYLSCSHSRSSSNALCTFHDDSFDSLSQTERGTTVILPKSE